MHPMAGKERFLLSLPGVLGGAFAIIIGCLVLVFAYPSLGRQADWGYALSPAAGAMLFILLGLAGGLSCSGWSAGLGRRWLRKAGRQSGD